MKVCSKGLFFFSLLCTLAIARGAHAGETYGTMCIGCDFSVHEACARESASQLGLAYTDKIWVLDPENVEFSAFAVDGTPPGGVIRDSTKSTTFIDLLPATLSTDDAEMIEETLIWIRDLVLDNGGQPNFSCSYSSLRSGAESDPKHTDKRDSSSTPVSAIISVPPELAESAFDLIGNWSRSIAVAQNLSSDFPAISFISSTLTFTGRILNLPINTEVVLLFQFSDGSSGVWEMDSVRERWVPDFSSFEDSDANRIPLSTGDIVGRQFDFSGQAPGEGNLENFLERMRNLGIPAPNPPDGGCPTSCTTLPDGEFSCTLNCG